MGERKTNEIRNRMDEWRAGLLTRRDLLGSLLAATGGYAAAHLLLESSGLAQTSVGDVASETIHYPSGDVLVEAYLAKPKTAGKHPAVIVIHESRGLNDNIRGIARRLAREGYVALAPDLLSRAGGTAKIKSPDDAAEAIASLGPAAPVGDLRAGFDYLAAQPDVEAQRISAVGFDWGAWRGFQFAIAEPKLYRAIVFYGPNPDTGFEKVGAQIMAHYAKWDNRITGNALWIDEQMKKAGKKFVYYVYEADHDFFNDTNPRYSPDAAKLAWQRTLDFLKS